jgi:uncharacterized Zn-binding protein involved in type VI secretion
MGMPAARLTDMHTCPMVTGVVPHVGGPIIAPGMPTVLIGGLPAARITDTCVCVGPPDVIVTASMTVFIGGLNAARIGDKTAHGGVIVTGHPLVLIGDQTTATAAGNMLGASATTQPNALQQASLDGKPFCEKCYQEALARKAARG